MRSTRASLCRCWRLHHCGREPNHNVEGRRNWSLFAWTRQNPGTDQPLYGAAYGEGRYIVVGAGGGSGRIFFSDGFSWSSTPSATVQPLVDAAWGGGMFVAVGLHGTIVSSADGKAWSLGQPGGGVTTESLLAVAYGRGQFAAIGNGVATTSKDGVRWSSPIILPGTFVGLAYGCGTFVATGDNGRIITSDDGLHWAARTSGTTGSLGRITYSGRSFFNEGVNGSILQSDPVVGLKVQNCKMTARWC